MIFPFPNNHSAISSQSFSSKDELQQALSSANVDLKWHESGRSELDRVFGKYNEMERFKSYIMAGCSLLFWEAIQCYREFHFSDMRFHNRAIFSRFSTQGVGQGKMASVAAIFLPSLLVRGRK